MEDVDVPLEKLYECFSQSKNGEDIIRSFKNLKSRLKLNSLHGLDLYKALKEKLGTQKTWKAREVFQLLEKRANQKEYMQQTAAEGLRVMIVGAGPIGLRQAIECVLLGTEVIVVEKRSSFAKRNNVLHLWPCTIEDLRQLGANKFYGKFCAGVIDHISIRSLQCILLKVCLLLGVTIHSGVEFLEILKPDETRGWHAKVSPEDHEAADFDFDVLVGADGHRSTIPGFNWKELRGKLALAITANFVNCYSREEAAVDEISGVASIFNQKFFEDLKVEMDIDLENIVYYKDDTHYFFMTAKKDSLLKKGVLKSDSDDTELLKPSNVETDELHEYVADAAEFCTDLQLHDFSLNHHGSPDVALFDFTSTYQAEHAAWAINRKGKDLLLCVVGDALLEPFWPLGTGCPRGFFSAMDTAWLIRGLGQKREVLDLLQERESIFQLLPQTFPESLPSNIKAYTINPQTRYSNLRVHCAHSQTIKELYDVDVKSGCDEELHEDKSAPTKAPTSRSKTPARPKAQFNPMLSSSIDICYFCGKKVYLMERMSANGLFFHRSCFRCSHCNCPLKIGGFSLSKGVGGEKGKFFCSAHYRQLFLSNPEAINYSRAGVPKRDSQQEEMEVKEKAKEVRPKPDSVQTGPTDVRGEIRILVEEDEEDEEGQPAKLLVKPSPSRPAIGGGNVKRLSQGFEQLEAAAKWDHFTPVGRDSGVAPDKPPRSRSQLEPSEGRGQLPVIDEKKEEEGGRVSPSSPRRPHSPSLWRGPIVKRLPEEEVKYLPRSSANLKRSQRKRRGPRSVTRPLIDTYDTSDVAIQERRKQQQRFREAQLIQREMSQLERQVEELEEVGRHIEQCLRDAEGTSQDAKLMTAWLDLVNERNSLIRRTSELSLRMKELELEDRQYEVDRELNVLCAIPDQTEEAAARFEELCEMKIRTIQERDEITMQLEEERIRELEEDEATSSVLQDRFESSDDSTPPEVELEKQNVSKLNKELNQLCAIPEPERTAAERARFEGLCERKRRSLEDTHTRELSQRTHRARASEPEAYVEAVLIRKKDKRQARMKAWFFGTS